MQGSTLAKRLWALLLLLTAAVYLWGLGRMPLVGPDEPRYAQVAREMFERADFVTPTLGGHAWFEKPALLYWMMMGSYAAFGVSEWAARLGAALAGVLTVFFVGWMARRVERAAGAQMRGLGLASAGVLATTAGLVVFSRGASFDGPLTTTVAASLACFFLAEIEERGARRPLYLAGFYAGLGSSLLAKGLAGVVVTLGVVCFYYLMRRRWPQVLRLGVWWGVPLALAVAAVWYAPVLRAHGWRFVEEFFVQHHFARYVSNRYHHPQPFYFYLPVMILLALPWTLFAVAGAWDALKTNWRAAEPPSRLRAFALAWLFVPLLFFSLSGSKLPGYVLPALPGAALLAGERLARYARGEGGVLLMRLTGALVLLVGLGGAAYAVRDGLVTLNCASAFAPPILFAGALALVWAHKRRLSAAVLVCAVLVVVALVPVCGLEGIGARESARALLERAASRGHASLPVLHLHVVERTSEFYAAGRLEYTPQGQPVRLEGPMEVVEAARRRGGAALVFVPVEYVEQLTGSPHMQTELIGNNGEFSLVLVRAK